MTKERKTPYNSRFAKAGVSCFYDSEVCIEPLFLGVNSQKSLGLFPLFRYEFFKAWTTMMIKGRQEQASRFLPDHLCWPDYS